MDCTPSELAVTDFAATGRTDTAGIADGEGREVVVQQERLFVRSLQGVDELLVFGSTERRDDQRLGLTAREQRRAMGARQNANFRHDRTDGLVVTAIDALAG